MSYDIWMEMETGSGNKAQVYEVGNYTYNCGDMFCMALGRSITSLDGAIGKDVVDTVWMALRDMVSRRTFYEEMNPANGWGDYEGAREYLRKLAYGCAEHPSATIRVV